MKNIIKNNQYEHQYMEAEKVEKLIKEKVALYDEQSEQLGIQHASELLPKIHGDAFSLYADPIKMKFRELVMEVGKIMMVGDETFETEEDRKHTEMKVRLLEEKKTEVIHKKRALVNLHERITETYVKGWHNIALFILALLALIEFGADSSALQGLGFSMLVSLGFGLGISLSVFSVNHQLKRILSITDSKALKLVIYAGISTFFALIFFILANFRIAVEGSSPQTGGFGPVVSFVVLNLCLHFASSVVSYFMLPSPEDEQKSTRKRELSIQIKSHLAYVESLENEIAALKDGFELRKMGRRKHYNYFHHLIAWIEELYQKNIGIYKSFNIQNRGDGVPDCFGFEVPELFVNGITLLNLKSSNHEDK